MEVTKHFDTLTPLKIYKKLREERINAQLNLKESHAMACIPLNVYCETTNENTNEILTSLLSRKYV